MIATADLATIAYKAAIDVRTRANVGRTEPVNIFDLAAKSKVEVRFMVGRTFEGMYEKERRIIVLPIDRPPGRRVFTCAHELGHWKFKHGSMIDDESTVESYNEKPEERMANMFAGYVLMFPPAVEWARVASGLNYETCNAGEIYSLASWFGVSYTSLLGHLRWSLKKLSDARYSELKCIPPRAIREELLQGRTSQHLVVMNRLTPRIPFDLEDGDFALLPPDSITDSKSLEIIESNAHQTLVQAVRPGIALLSNRTSSWSAAARVMRRGFSGRAIFRNLETDDDE